MDPGAEKLIDRQPEEDTKTTKDQSKGMEEKRKKLEVEILESQPNLLSQPKTTVS